MILNTGLGQDLEQGDSSSPVVWIVGILIGGYLLNKVLSYENKGTSKAYGWGTARGRKGFKRLTQQDSTVRQLVAKSKVVPQRRSKLLSKKNEQRLFGDLYA